MRQPKQVVMAASFAAALFAHSHAGAAGFALIEHSAQGMGNAFAGGGAAAGDTSSMWFNPASMTALPAGTQFQVTGHVILPSFEFSDRGSRQSVGGGVTIPLLPGALTRDDGGELALVPNLYFKHDLSDDLRFGVSLNVPFGLATKYKPNWSGRYQAIESEIKTFNLNPSIAYRINDAVSIGAGLSLMYIDAKLSNAIDFDAVCAATAGGCTGVPGSGSSDGFVNNEADDWGYGFNLGLLLQFSPGTRVSLAYRSQVKQSLEGSADFTVPAGISVAPAAQAGIEAVFADDRINAKVDLPDSLSLSVYHELDDRWSLMGDATWTGWSSIPELRIVFDRPATAGGPGVETLGWDDTIRLSLGANYKASRHWTLRAGVAYDQAPVSDPTFRTARLPDNDRIWASLGASYQYSDRLAMDFGYSHLFIDDTRIQRIGSTGNILIGEYESDVDILSAQLRYSW